MRGKHQKIKSLLGDEDIHQLITEYLWRVSCDVTVDKFKAYIEQEVFPSVGIENEKSISNTTYCTRMVKTFWLDFSHRKQRYLL